jgi:hypothetical protein
MSSENADAGARGWIGAALGDERAWSRLVEEMAPSELWSLLLEIFARRAAARRPSEVLRQWERDRFTPPAATDQRTILRMDTALLDVAAAAGFETIELSPVAPLGTCAAVALTGQNRVLSALRGTEVVSDPTNVFALECARRMKRVPTETVRLATTQRVVRAQPAPRGPGFAQHFRLFALGSGGIEARDHAFVVGEMVAHARAHLAALDALGAEGYALGERSFTLWSTPARAALADRVAEALAPTGVPIARAALERPYYTGGLRFMLFARSPEGDPLPLSDCGAFDWLTRLTSNRRAVYVASGLGTQLVAMRCRPR